VTLIILSGGIAVIISLFGTPLLIRRLQRRGYSQAIRESTDDAQYPEHAGKLGTPSMGGLAMVIAILAGYFGVHIVFWSPPSASGLLGLWLIVGLAAVGMADDYLKIFKQRSTGIRARTKLIGQAFVAISFAILALQFPDESGLTPASQAISFVRETPLVLPIGLFVLWVWFLVTATTNGVNLTMDWTVWPPGPRWQASSPTSSSPSGSSTSPAGRPSTRTATRCVIRWTLLCSRRRAAVPASDSSGGTPTRPGSSWGTPARWRSGVRSLAWPS